MKVQNIFIPIDELFDMNIKWGKLSYNNLVTEFDPMFVFSDIYLIQFSDQSFEIVSPNTKFLSFLFHVRNFSRQKYRKDLTNSCKCCIIDAEDLLKTVSLNEFRNRYTTGDIYMDRNEIEIENISEETESYSNDDLYNISSWGADLSFRELILLYDDGDLVKPELQRKYVWSKSEASRFIDSVLLGLPVPSIFLAKEKNEKMLIIDGYQRIMTVRDFVRGIFSGDETSFKLSNSDIINEKWRGKAFNELSPEEQRRIKTTTIHAIVFEQKHPRDDDSSMYQIFERINTTGKTLKPQEIRNCIYQGSFNSLLFELNKKEKWRKVVGLENEDSRMSDIELILRFFAMYDLHDRPEKSLRQIKLLKYLNSYMQSKQNIDEEQIESMRSLFLNMVDYIDYDLDDEIYNIIFKNTVVSRSTSKIHPAIFDAISVAAAWAVTNGVPKPSKDEYVFNYARLLVDLSFKNSIGSRTTDMDNIQTRISLATKFLYGIDYEW